MHYVKNGKRNMILIVNIILMYGTLTVAEPLILKNVDYNVIFLSNF